MMLGALLLAAVVLDAIFPLRLPARDTGSTVVVARDGTPLRAFADSDGVWRYPITAKQVSPLYLTALLTYEDRWFYWHPGINPYAMARGIAIALRHGHILSGGSTLTMQVARIIMPMPHTFVGKFVQMFRALQLEAHLSKAQILDLYLNHAPFGGPIEGVQAGQPALTCRGRVAGRVAAITQPASPGPASRSCPPRAQQGTAADARRRHLEQCRYP
jgi:penicillin-binding protein 1C